MLPRTYGGGQRLVGGAGGRSGPVLVGLAASCGARCTMRAWIHGHIVNCIAAHGGRMFRQRGRYPKIVSWQLAGTHMNLLDPPGGHATRNAAHVPCFGAHSRQKM